MPTADASPLARIDEEIGAVRRLLQLVESEQHSLMQAASADELQTLAARKSEAVEQISALTHLRYAALARLGLLADEAGMRDWLEQGADAALRERWESLLALARKIKAVNQVNGHLIAKLMNQNQTTLGLLGMATQAPSLYGPNGLPKGFGSGYLK